MRRELSLVRRQSTSAGKASPGERCKLLYSSPAASEYFVLLPTILSILCHILVDFYSAAALHAM